MKPRTRNQLLATVATFVQSYAPAGARVITGQSGSPSATTTIDGKYIPGPPPKFGGEIGLSAPDSKPYWPGVIPTPSLDRIAQMGLRYTQFHSTALCSPTRAALITGRNHHSVGFGVITEQSRGYPGYNSVIGPENAAVGAASDRLL
jgi:Sulfatase